MEIVEEFEDPRDKEPATFELPNDKKNLLKRRGFFPTMSNLIDDTFYTTRKDVKRITHLNESLSVLQLVNLSVDEMEKVLYKKDSMAYMEVSFYHDEKIWNDSFAGYKLFYDVDPLCLEPYIARYIRMINRCGMETFFSCDGWHEKPEKSREMVILFRDRYAWLWHKQLCEIIEIGEYCLWKHVNEGSDYIARIKLPREDKQKIQIYNQIERAAEIFDKEEANLKKLKESIVCEVRANDMDTLSNNEIESIFRKHIMRT